MDEHLAAHQTFKLRWPCGQLYSEQTKSQIINSTENAAAAAEILTHQAAVTVALAALCLM